MVPYHRRLLSIFVGWRDDKLYMGEIEIAYVTKWQADVDVWTGAWAMTDTVSIVQNTDKEKLKQEMLDHLMSFGLDEGQLRMHRAAEALFKIPAVYAQLHENDFPRETP
jgi:hypothetical protein